MNATKNMITAPASAQKSKPARNYFSRFSQGLARAGRTTFFLLVAVPAIILFTQKQMSAQEKPDASKDSKPKISLLTPLNVASRLSPFAYCGPTQAVYFGKVASDKTMTNLFLLWHSFGSVQTGVEYMTVSKNGQTTKSSGATAKLNGTSFLGGQFSTAARITNSASPDGKSSTNVDAGFVASQPYGLPVSVSVSAGPSQNCQMVCAGSAEWAVTGIRKETKAGDSYSAGADFQATYSSTISQRFYASYEYSISDSKKSFIAGSRFFVPFGNLEFNYEHVSCPGFAQPQNNISFRLGYYIQ
ncbi:MAG: hypothetical protein WC506_04620 [Candidatus Micrarchaeia archaeon]